MCDYSLLGFPNRLAQEGETLTLTIFTTGTRGFAVPQTAPTPIIRKRTLWNLGGLIEPSASKQKPPCVGCLPEGARLLLTNLTPRFAARFNVCSTEEVKFVQLSAKVNAYRDAVQFKNGRRALLQELPEGTLAEVLSVESAPVREIGADFDFTGVILPSATQSPADIGDRATQFIAGLD